MRHVVQHLPIVRWMLHVMPVIYAARTGATALWSAPSGPYPLNSTPAFEILYAAATAGYLLWALLIHTRLRLSVYLGTSLGLLCMFRAVTIVEARHTFGSVAYSAVVNWCTFSLSTLLTVTLSAQYILVMQGRKDDDGEAA